MHPHVEFLIMEAVLKHPEKTLAELAHDVCVQTGSQYTYVYHYITLYTQAYAPFLSFPVTDGR